MGKLERPIHWCGLALVAASGPQHLVSGSSLLVPLVLPLDLFAIFAGILLLAALGVGAAAVVLRRRARRLAAIMDATLESTTDGILIVDPKGRIICFNRRFLQIWRLGESVLVTREDTRALSAVVDQLKDGTAFYSKVQELYATPEAQSEDILEFKDGRVFERYSKPLVTGGKHAGRVWRFRDVSGQMRAEKALAQERILLRTLVDSLPDYIYAKDLNSRFLLVNTPGARMMGAATPDDLLGKTDFDFYPNELASQYRADEVQLFESGQSLIGHAEPCWEPATNTPKWILTSKVPFRDESGKVVGLIGSGRDITELTRLTEELAHAKAEAEAASRAKSEFLANMSHEVRTPMNGILGMTELALQTELTCEQREYLNTVNLSAESLLTVINDILDYSKVEAGKLVLERIEFDLANTLEETVRLLAPAAKQKGLELTSLVAPGVPRRVIGDPTRIKQVVTNLLGNALKFTERGVVALEVRLETELQPESRQPDSGLVATRFTVRDTGIGIAPEKQELIFQAFAQSDTSTTRRFGGTGLGLTISARLVEMMGGRIWVQSTPGQGSSFHFTMPFEIVPRDDRAPERITHHTRRQPFRALRILLVEDNAINQMLGVRMLENCGHSVTLACNGEEALDKIKRAAFDLVLMDLQMPRMDGFEATIAVREREKGSNRHLPIIAMTACAMKGDPEKCLAAGMDGYVSKPVRMAELLAAIHALVPEGTTR